MTNGYRPFFKRKFITAVMWLSFFAIVILSSLGPSKVEFHDIEHNPEKNLYWMQVDDQPNTLSLLLETPSALNQQQRQLQQLLSNIINHRLQDLGAISFSQQVIPRQDRIEVNLSWASGQATPDLDRVWQQLQQPIESKNWQDELKNLQARDYLDNQSSEQQLINQFMQQLQPESQAQPISQLASAYQALLQSPIYVVSGDEAEEIAEQLQTRASQTPRQSITGVALKPYKQTRQTIDDSQYRILLGQALPSRQDDDFISHRLAFRVLQDLLNEYQDQHQLQFRLIWSALKQTGYQAIILKGSKNPAPLLPQLNQLVTEDLVELSQSRLSSQWQENMRQYQNQQRALAVIAFYDLDPEGLENYSEQIQDQDPEEVIKIVRKALQIEQQISILQTPAN